MIWSSAVEAQEAVGCVAWQQEHPCSPASHQESSWEHQTYLSSRGPLASLLPNPSSAKGSHCTRLCTGLPQLS